MKGTITPALLVIAGAFIIVIYGLLFILSLQFDFSQRQIAQDKALHIAEAGINYYRWHWSKYPDDFADGTGNGRDVQFLEDEFQTRIGEDDVVNIFPAVGGG